MDDLSRALRTFDGAAFTKRHSGRKESRSDQSHEYLFTCPHCGGSNLRWNSRKYDVGSWICWGCKRSGGTLALVELFERCDTQDAIAFILDGYVGGDANLELVGVAAPKRRAARPSLKVLPRMSWPAHVELVLTAAGDMRGYTYLRWRGLTDEDLSTHRVGIGMRGWLKDYAVFPVFMDGGLVYWQGRATWDAPAHMTKEEQKQWKEETGYRKTLNPFTRDDAQATAGDVLFNYDRARAEPHVVICEGPIDAIKVGPHAVALLGKGTDAKLERLRRMGASRYTIYLDRDAEAQSKAEQIAAELAQFAPVHLAVPPEGHDPGSLTPEYNAQVIQSANIWVKNQLKSALK
jgi:hypothetical protein